MSVHVLCSAFRETLTGARGTRENTAMKRSRRYHETNAAVELIISRPGIRTAMSHEHGPLQKMSQLGIDST